MSILIPKRLPLFFLMCLCIASFVGFFPNTAYAHTGNSHSIDGTYNLKQGQNVVGTLEILTADPYLGKFNEIIDTRTETGSNGNWVLILGNKDITADFYTPSFSVGLLGSATQQLNFEDLSTSKYWHYEVSFDNNQETVSLSSAIAGYDCPIGTSCLQ